MKQAGTLAFLGLISSTAAAPLTTNPKILRRSVDLGIPSGCQTSYNGIASGWLPDYSGPQPLMGTINRDTGKEACTYGFYSQITSTTYDDSQLTSIMSDVKSSGAVFVPAIMPTQVTFSDVYNSNLPSQIAATVEKFTSQNITVWLRFSHEMNWYVNDASGPTYAGGSTQDFIQAWQAVANAVKDNSFCHMFWTPNVAKSSDLQAWWPGADYVQLVGMDYYPDPGTSFSDAFHDFYSAFAAPNNLPFALGETGSNSGDVSAKEDWLKQVTMADYTDYPLYVSQSWFEYYKGMDFRTVIGQSSATITETLSNFV